MESNERPRRANAANLSHRPKSEGTSPSATNNNQHATHINLLNSRTTTHTPSSPTPAKPPLLLQQQLYLQQQRGSGPTLTPSPAPALAALNVASRASPGAAAAAAESDEEVYANPNDSSEKKLRFVWAAQMHMRFEAAVHKLGIAHAKPQAIRQLMGCEGEEDAPTRQNIKSHLQKYRLLIHKQVRKSGGSSSGAGTSLGVERELKLKTLRKHHHLSLQQQSELQAQLQQQLEAQREMQLELSHQLSKEKHATMSQTQLARLAQHVMLQRQLLQHLFAMLQAHTEDLVSESSRLVSLPPAAASATNPASASAETTSGATVANWGNHYLSDNLEDACVPTNPRSAPVDVSQVPLQAEVFDGFDL